MDLILILTGYYLANKMITSDLFVEKPKLSGGLKEMRILKTTQSGFTGNSFVM